MQGYIPINIKPYNMGIVGTANRIYFKVREYPYYQDEANPNRAEIYWLLADSTNEIVTPLNVSGALIVNRSIVHKLTGTNAELVEAKTFIKNQISNELQDE